MSTPAEARTAARLLLNDHFARFSTENPEDYAANVDRLLTGACRDGVLEDVLRAVLDLLADQDTARAHYRLVHRTHAVAYADGDVLAAEALGHRPTDRTDGE